MKTRLIFSWGISLLLIMASCSKEEQTTVVPPDEPEIETDTFDFPKSETFTFSSNGIDKMGKIYFQDSSENNNSLPAIYLLDYKEQHFTVTTDETEQVIRGIRKISGLDALVVTLDAHLNIDTDANTFQNHYNVFKDMATYVDSNYTDNTSRTFIAKGSEAGVVLLSLLSEDQESSVFTNFIATDSPPSFNDVVIDRVNNSNVPDYLIDKKLHFSFSTSNDPINCLELISAFEDAQFPWLIFESKRYYTDYNNTYPLSFAAGLKFVFED